jgi:hypothetical protein
MAGEHEDHLGAAGTEQPRPEQRPGRVADSQMGAVPGGPGVVDDPSRGTEGWAAAFRVSGSPHNETPGILPGSPPCRPRLGVGGAALAMWIALVAAAACLAAWTS